jgi:RNA polymerase sigma factor (sigma-70 family)
MSYRQMNLFQRQRVLKVVTTSEINVVSDAVLIGRIVNGEADAATALVERHSPALRRFAARAGVNATDVDDVLQETWIRVVRSAHRYDPERPFPGWIFAILMNRVRSRWQQSRPREDSLFDGASSVPSADRAADAQLVLDQRAAAIRSLVAQLPAPLADTVLLRYFEELSEREVAAQLGIPIGTVKSRIHTGLRRLKTEIERILHAH